MRVMPAVPVDANNTEGGEKMETTVDQERKTGAQTFCSSMEGHHSRKKWCGSFMVVIGLLWLGALSGWINGDFFGPLFLMLMGIWIILPPLLSNVRKSKN
jgi:fatty acid desaturase